MEFSSALGVSRDLDRWRKVIRLTLLRNGGDAIATAMKRHSNRALAFSSDRRLVVFWNVTSRCNLSCPQCYIGAEATTSNEMSTAEAQAFIDDLASVKVPLLMFSGGEPLIRPDFWDLARHAQEMGIKTAVSTNGTLIDDEAASRLKELGVEYVGVSLDGATEETHDRIRGQGSYAKAVRGLESCLDVGLKCGVRVTATMENFKEIPALLDLTARLGVPRFCLYWLVPSGRGRNDYRGRQLKPDQVKAVFDQLYEAAGSFDPDIMEILTVDAPQDGAYLLERLSSDKEPALDNALTLLQRTGDSCSAGDRVANVDSRGNVYPCQFLQMDEYLIGNVTEQRFSSLWIDEDNHVLNLFRNKRGNLEGACQGCTSKDVCVGGCKARALYERGSIWASDPFCTKINKTDP